MNYTTNYHLPQWVETDRLLMDDFNAMTSAIDTALDGHDTQLSGFQAQVATKGDCFIVSGTYTGTGGTGAGSPCTLSFDKKPMLVAILPAVDTDSGGKSMVLVRGSSLVYPYPSNYNSRCTVTWTDTGVSWYHPDTAVLQFNQGGAAYNYVALLAAD